MPEAIHGTDSIKPGEIYEDTFCHPCLCLGVDVEGGCAWGVSLIDGSYPRTCDLFMSGIRKLTPEEAWRWKELGPDAIAAEYNAEFPDVEE